MRKISLLTLIFLLVVVPIANSTTDVALNDFFKMYSSTFKIEPIWAAAVQTPTGENATISLIKLSWVDKEGKRNVEKRFYANYKGAQHFSDGQNVEIAREYPSGLCKFESPDKSCGITHIDFMFLNKNSDNQLQYYRFNLEVVPETGIIKEARANEIIVDETKTIGKKWDIEDENVDIENIKVPLIVAHQNGMLTENLVLEHVQAG